MRILFVTDFYDPYRGGVEIHVQTVAEALVRRGHEVAVATMPPGDGQPARSEDGPVRVYPITHLTARIGRGFANGARPWAPPFPDPVAMVGLARVVRSFRPDVIHGHDWLARSALPRFVSGGVPVVTSLHYYTRTCAKKTLWRDGTTCAGPSLANCLRCAADHYGTAKGAIVTIGLRAGSKIEDRATRRWISVSTATALGNGIDRNDPSAVIANPLAPIARCPSAADHTLPDGVPDGPFILFVGDLRPEKGIHVLLSAVDELRRGGVDVPLVLAGERTADHLEPPSNTVELGLVDHGTVQALWRRATVGVVPSLWPEPFGLVAIEAMAAGCPLVASAVGGLTDILGDERGAMVPAGDVEALAAALCDLLDDPTRREHLAAAAHRSLDRYDTDRIVEAIEAEYTQAISERP